MLTEKQQAALENAYKKIADPQGVMELVQISQFQLPIDHPVRKWSYKNILLMFAQTNCPDCRSAAAWKTFGRHPSAGSSAIYIWRPRPWQKEKIVDGVIVKNEGITFSLFPEFPYDRTTAFPGREQDYQPIVPASATPPPALAEVAVRIGVPITYEVMAPGHLGGYNLRTRSIRLSTEDPGTLAHELGHAVQHYLWPREVKAGQDAAQEAMAEFVAMVVCTLYGLPYAGDAAAYIAQYAKDPATAVRNVLGTAGKVIDFIMNGTVTNEEVTQNEE